MISAVSFSASTPRPSSLPPEDPPRPVPASPPPDFLLEEAALVRDTLLQRRDRDYIVHLNYAGDKALAGARHTLASRLRPIAELFRPEQAREQANWIDGSLTAYESAKKGPADGLLAARGRLEASMQTIYRDFLTARLDASSRRFVDGAYWTDAKAFARSEYFKARLRERARASLPVRLIQRGLDRLFPNRVETVLPIELQSPYRVTRGLEGLYALSTNGIHANPTLRYHDDNHGTTVGREKKRFRMTRTRLEGVKPPTFEVAVQDFAKEHIRTRKYVTPEAAAVPNPRPGWQSQLDAKRRRSTVTPPGQFLERLYVLETRRREAQAAKKVSLA